MAWKIIVIGAVLIWCACDQQKRIEKEVSWMEKQGYSQEEINSTIADEYPPQDISEYSPE